MKPTPSNPESDWEKTLARARADVGPPADLHALLRVVREASSNRREGWAGEFTALFTSGRIVSRCLAGAAVFGLVATWQAWSLVQELPWAQFLDSATGGGS